MTRTHTIDMIMKFISMLTSLFFSLSIPVLEDKGVILMSIMVALSVVLYIYFFRTLGSFLYCRLILKMPVTVNEAGKLNPALAPNPFAAGGMEWLPLREVKQLSPDERYNAALKIMENWMAAKRAELAKKSRLLRTYEIIAGVLLVVFYIMISENIPPAGYVIKMFCDWIGTDFYSPLLLTLIFAVIVFLPYVLLKRYQSKK